MEGDNRHPTFCRQVLPGSFESRFKCAQLVVDSDPKCLERLGGRVDLAVPIARRNRITDNLHKLYGRLNRLLSPPQDNRFRNPSGVAFLAVAKEHVGNHLLVPLVEDFRCGKARARPLAVAHVQGFVLEKRESPSACQLLAVPP